MKRIILPSIEDVSSKLTDIIKNNVANRLNGKIMELRKEFDKYCETVIADVVVDVISHPQIDVFKKSIEFSVSIKTDEKTS